MDTPDDILRAGLAGDLDGHLEPLMRAYQGRLYALALRLAGDTRDAEEIVQDTFVRAYRALSRYPADQIRTLALRPWLYRIALNIARNRARRRALPTVALEDDGHEPGAAEPGLARVDDRAGLAPLVAALPARYRTAVLLRHVHGLSYAEMAAALDRPVGTCKSDVHRGVQILRERMLVLQNQT